MLCVCVSKLIRCAIACFAYDQFFSWGKLFTNICCRVWGQHFANNNNLVNPYNLSSKQGVRYCQELIFVILSIKLLYLWFFIDKTLLKFDYRAFYWNDIWITQLLIYKFAYLMNKKYSIWLKSDPLIRCTLHRTSYCVGHR